MHTAQPDLPVCLQDMLQAREDRVARQAIALARHGLPLVSASAVMPGPVKDTTTTRTVMAAAAAALEALCHRHGWPVARHDTHRAPTGTELLLAVRADAAALKRATVELEETHPLGRLWDLDVIAPQGGGISRGALGLPPRRCLVCDAPAHECARSRRHPLPQVLAAIEELAHAPGTV